MARLVTSGYEIQDSPTSLGVLQTDHPDGSADALAATSGSVDTSVFRSGLASLKFNTGAGPTAGTSLFWAPNHWTFVTGRKFFVRCYHRFPNIAPAGNRVIARLTSGSGWIGAVKLQTDGTIGLYYTSGGNGTTGVGTKIGSSSASLVANTWHRISWSFIVDTSVGTNGALELYLDGVLVASTSGINLGTVAPTTVGFGFMTNGSDSNTLDTNFVQNLDDVAINDDQGANQNSYPGVGRVWLLKPVSPDVSRVGWTAGSAGTTNLWDAVNNTPPVGVANGSITTTSQIRDTAANTTDNVQLTLQDYTTAGVPTSDIITVLRLVANGGENGGAASTGYQLLSNPVISEDVVAYSAGNVGTYPTNWAWHKNAAVYSPTPTRGTGPVAEVRRAATTNNSHVDFLGLIVESTLGAPTNTVLPSISGTVSTGNTLTRVAGTWTDDGTGSLTYAWFRETAVGSGSYSQVSTGTTYAVTAADADLRLYVAETDTQSSNSAAATANSATVGPVTLSGYPHISGYLSTFPFAQNPSGSYLLPYPGQAGANMGVAPNNNHVAANWGSTFLNKGSFGNPTITSPYVYHGDVIIGGNATLATVTYQPNALGVQDADPATSVIGVETIGGRSYVHFKVPVEVWGNVDGGGTSSMTKAQKPGILFNGLRVRAANSPTIAHAADPENDTSWQTGAGSQPGARGIQTALCSGATIPASGSAGTIKLYLSSNSAIGLLHYGVDRFRVGNKAAVPTVVTFTGISQSSAVTTLTAAMGAADTSATVASGSGIQNGDCLDIDNETVLVTAGGGTSTLTVTRAQQGTKAATHLFGAAVTDNTFTATGCTSLGPGGTYVAGQNVNAGVDRNAGRILATYLVYGQCTDLHLYYGGDGYGGGACHTFGGCEPETPGNVMVDRFYLQYYSNDGFRVSQDAANVRVKHGSVQQHPGIFLDNAPYLSGVHGDGAQLGDVDNTALDAATQPMFDFVYWVSDRGNSGVFGGSLGLTGNLSVRHCLFSCDNKAFQLAKYAIRTSGGVNVAGTLTTAVTTTPAAGTAETWQLSSKTGFAANDYAVIDSEYVRITSIAGSSSPFAFGVIRGGMGTTPAAHSLGATLSDVKGCLTPTVAYSWADRANGDKQDSFDIGGLVGGTFVQLLDDNSNLISPATAGPPDG